MKVSWRHPSFSADSIAGSAFFFFAISVLRETIQTRMKNQIICSNLALLSIKASEKPDTREEKPYTDVKLPNRTNSNRKLKNGEENSFGLQHLCHVYVNDSETRILNELPSPKLDNVLICRIFLAIRKAGRNEQIPKKA